MDPNFKIGLFLCHIAISYLCCPDEALISSGTKQYIAAFGTGNT